MPDQVYLAVKNLEASAKHTSPQVETATIAPLLRTNFGNHRTIIEALSTDLNTNTLAKTKNTSSSHFHQMICQTNAYPSSINSNEIFISFDLDSEEERKQINQLDNMIRALGSEQIIRTNIPHTQSNT